MPKPSKLQMKLREALPGPNQVALGGVDPKQTKVHVSGFGVLSYEQVYKEVEKLSKELSDYLHYQKPENQSPEQQTSMSGKNHEKRYVVHNLKSVSDKLNVFLPALISHLEKGK